MICNDPGQSATITGAGIPEVICGFDGDDTINGRGGADILVGGDGDDTLLGGAADDYLYGEAGIDTLLGEGNNDTIFGGPGNGFLDGGTGNDYLVGDDGDDEIYGGDGNDTLAGRGGRNHLDGGAGDDYLTTPTYGQTSVPDDVVGSTYCGGAGNDAIYARGPAHQCVDGGSGTDSCDYSFFVSGRTAGTFDVATQIGCETTTGTAFLSRTPPCGCL